MTSSVGSNDRLVCERSKKTLWEKEEIAGYWHNFLFENVLKSPEL